MSLEHFAILKDVAKDKGIKVALEADLIKTLERHPKLAQIVMAVRDYLSKSPTEIVNEVYSRSKEDVNKGGDKMRINFDNPMLAYYGALFNRAYARK